MKTQACLLMVLMFRCEASSQEKALQRKDIRRISEWEKMKGASKTLIRYGIPVTAYDFFKRYSGYYKTHKSDFFSYRKAFFAVGKETGYTAAKRAFLAFPFLMIYQSAKQNVELKRLRLQKRD